MKNRHISLILIILMTLCLAACGGHDDEETTTETEAQSLQPFNRDDLVGTWKGTQGEPSTLTLGKNGSYRDVADFASIIGSYIVDPALRTITVNESEYGRVFVYHFELSDNELTIQTNGGLPRHFVKEVKKK